MRIKAHRVCEGVGEGEAVVYKGAFSFLGDIDPVTGELVFPGHELEGTVLADKVFVIVSGKGSTGGSRIAWLLARNGVAPSAIICLESEPVLACSVIAAEIPTVDKLERDPFEVIKTGDYLRVDGTEGFVEIVEKENTKD